MIRLQTIIVLCLVYSNCIGQAKFERSITADFTSIEVGSGVDLYLLKGTENKIVVECLRKLAPDIITEVNLGILEVKTLEQFRWGFKQAPKVYVTYKKLTSLTAFNGADVYGQSPLVTNKFVLSISGGSDVYMDIQVDSLSIFSIGGSSAKLSGNTKYLIIKASSGSVINSGDMLTQDCNVSSTGGSEAIVNVGLSLNAYASEGSSIGYIGKPEKTELVETGGAAIYRK